MLLILIVAILPATRGCAECGAQAYDLQGRVIDPLEGGRKATVLLFMRTDCPISRRYAPEVRRLHQKFEPRDVALWLVYPDKDESADQIREHLKEFEYTCPTVRDIHHALVRKTGATVTPEAAVFTADGIMVYRGRIDDRFVDFGKARARPTTHDLEQVLEALVEGRSIQVTTTKAVGCFIPDLS